MRPNPVEYWLQQTSTKGDPIAMSIIPHQKRYLPHEIGTRIHAVTLYRSAKDIEFVCRRYKISKASLMRWNKRYDGTPESLADRSHRPHTVHPRAHTNEEIMWVLNLVRRNPDIPPCELYGKLRRKHGYTRHPLSLYRLFVRLGLRKKPVSTKKRSPQQDGAYPSHGCPLRKARHRT